MPKPEADLQDRTRFDELMRRWTDETEHISSTSQFANHPACHEIIAMGESALPLPLEEIDNHPTILGLVALKAIIGTNPFPPRPETTLPGWPKRGWPGVASMDIGGDIPPSRSFPRLNAGNQSSDSGLQGFFGASSLLASSWSVESGLVRSRSNWNNNVATAGFFNEA
jgi:hypothetical protein